MVLLVTSLAHRAPAIIAAAVLCLHCRGLCPRSVATVCLRQPSAELG
jgi:hypothetical protein